MKSTSRGFEKKIASFLLCLPLLIALHYPVQGTSHASPVRKDKIILFEFTQKEIPETSARNYFEGLHSFLNKRLSMDYVRASSLKRKVVGQKELLPVHAETVNLWKETLTRGKRYFNMLEVEKGIRELSVLNQSPYRFRLEGRALALVQDSLLSCGFILYKTGRMKESERLLSRYLFLSGNESISEYAFPPDFVGYFREVSKKGHYVTLAINSTPSMADVFLKGEQIGKTPLFEKIRTFGGISLSVKKDGFLEYIFHRVVMPEDRISLDLDLEIDEVSAIERQVEMGDYAGMAEGVGRIVGKRGFKGGLVAVLKGDKTPKRIDYIVTRFERGEHGKNFSLHRDHENLKEHFQPGDMNPLFRDELFLSLIPQSVDTEGLGEGYKREKLTSKWYFWAIMGVGAVGIVYAISREGDNKSGGSINIEF